MTQGKYVRTEIMKKKSSDIYKKLFRNGIIVPPSRKGCTPWNKGEENVKKI